VGIIARTPGGFEIHDRGGPHGPWSCGTYDAEGVNHGGCGKCWRRYKVTATGKRKPLPCWHLSRWFDEVATGTISNYFTLTEYGLRRAETCECGPNRAPPWIESPRPPPVKLAKNSAQRSKDRRARKFRRLQDRARGLSLSDDPTQGRDGIERAIEQELERLAGERARARLEEEAERERRRWERSAEENRRLEESAAAARARAAEIAEDRRRARETGEARRVLSRAEAARVEKDRKLDALVAKMHLENEARAARRAGRKAKP
jgi:hypothetical protein